MKKPFREYHLLSLLEEYDQGNLPIDAQISRYFRSHKALGSKDRRYIADTIYRMIRWKGLIDNFLSTPRTWEKRYKKFLDFDPSDYQKDETIPQQIRVSFPKSLFDKIISSHGEERAIEICLSSNLPAPTTIRVNSLKTNREKLLSLLEEKGCHVLPCETAPNGIRFVEKALFTSFSEFELGYFEMQDEASQIVGEMVEVSAGDHVLDYCAGAGGKTLAFAPKMENRGQIYLHDIRSHALREAKKRLCRAGIQNAQFIEASHPHLKKLKKKMDWVLVDAPCSGTGTLRRNPDMKWKFDDEMLIRLQGEQRAIFEKALSYTKSGGHIVYATCSILREENEMQLEHFLKTYSLEMVGKPFQTIPQKNSMDGFYAVVLAVK